ncbi:MAG: hypothetical protein OXD50_15625 [Chloroflexi bacterium]|nr:hypothetical protein [Chloroflexota bacterium]
MVEEGEASEPSDYWSGARFYYELARSELDMQIGAIDALDRKLAATFSLNGALIALIAAAFTFREGDLSVELWALLTAMVVVFALNAVCTFFAYRLRRWKIGPDLKDFTEFASDYDTEALIQWAAAQIQESCAENEETLRSKANWVRFATALTMVDLSIAAVAAIVATWPW